MCCRLFLYFTLITYIYASYYGEITFPDEETSASEALNAFSLKLLSKTNNDERNTIISPYTLWIALSVINEGASGNTAREIAKTLGIPSSKNRRRFRQLQRFIVQNVQHLSDDITLDMCTDIFARDEAVLNKTFQSRVRNIYSVQVTALDFNNAGQAAQYINDKISKITRGRIPQIVEADNLVGAEMYVTCALFFKGLWRDSFRTSKKKHPFHNENLNAIGIANMMYKSKYYAYGLILDEKAKLLELPYKGDRLSMIILLPTKDTLSSILSDISKLSFKNLLQVLRITEEVDVVMPKFEISTSMELEATLFNMGISQLFRDTANLTNISLKPLRVSSIKHKATIQVDEDGTVAAAATQVEAIPIMLSYNIDFTVDRPFAFFVYDKRTESILFSGTVYNPNLAPNIN